MERIEAVNVDRIAWCCADFGMSMSDLAVEVGISEESFERAAKGHAALTFNQLRKIANFFGRGVLFFLEPAAVVAAEAHSTAFRTIANQKPDLSPKLRLFVERVERQRQIFIDLFNELENAAPPEFSPPTLAGGLEKKATAVRSWLQLANRNSFDTYRSAVESRNVLVFRSNGYLGKWNIPKDSAIVGFAIWKKTCPIIVVKADRSEARQSFTLMHELAHLLLHKKSAVDDAENLDSPAGRERDANALAGAILVPAEFLKQVDDDARPDQVTRYDEWLAAHCKAWGVSTEVVLRRLHDQGRLSTSKYDEYRAWRASLATQNDGGGTRMYRYREPKHLFGDRFVRTVLDSLSNGTITLAKASGYLDGLKIKDLHALENYYADA